MEGRFLRSLRSLDAMRLFHFTVEIILKLMAPMVIVVLLIGVWGVVAELWRFLAGEGGRPDFTVLLANILSIFVVIELLRSILEYFEVHRLKISLITEAALVFLLREVMIGVYQHSLKAPELFALAALILVIGGLRTLAVIFSPRLGGKYGE